MPSQDQLAIVTGAGSGLGRETARLLAGAGWHVLAGVRKDADREALAADNIEPVILDITDQAQIDALLARVDGDPGRPLSVLVNNAGILLNAPIETLSLADWRRLFDVNLFGHVAMTKAFLPALLGCEGRIVNVSSIGGRVAMPTYGPYAASKFALEAFSDVLRREVGRFGVTVIVVEPGTIATSIWDKQSAVMQELPATWTPGEHERYGSLQETARGLAADADERGLDPAEAAQVIVEAITSGHPETRYLIGDAVPWAQTLRELSDHDLDEMAREIFG
jgi:NAD(P)-dependent dehydrogenase (short-subunit alcohol dehydrogenase family)